VASRFCKPDADFLVPAKSSDLARKKSNPAIFYFYCSGGDCTDVPVWEPPPDPEKGRKVVGFLLPFDKLMVVSEFERQAQDL